MENIIEFGSNAKKIRNYFFIGTGISVPLAAFLYFVKAEHFNLSILFIILGSFSVFLLLVVLPVALYLNKVRAPRFDKVKEVFLVKGKLLPIGDIIAIKYRNSWSRAGRYHFIEFDFITGEKIYFYIKNPIAGGLSAEQVFVLSTIIKRAPKIPETFFEQIRGNNFSGRTQLVGKNEALHYIDNAESL